ncbi:TlpA disulfide reductase family protein [Apibacter sp. HY039]|uniref:TlpA family protein disulfide reductase n=1 Tax=Apibacter sp. HY039 TaxID=2501476 RepID=UPI000FEB767C|nr:TlpA disulfide reductase family protein [Apibacter sp. HY039]
MKKILILSLLISSLLQAQFTFKGTINNYPNQRVVVKIAKAFDEFLIGNYTTDTSGSFSVSIKEKYIGIISISLLDAVKTYSFISDNTPISFIATLNQDNNLVLNSPGNEVNRIYQEYQIYSTKKDAVLPQLQSIQNFYKSTDVFYMPLIKEISSIITLKEPDTSAYPFLTYYISAENMIKSTEADDSSKNMNIIIDYLKNAGEEFETFGIGRSLLLNYLRATTANTSTQQQWESNVDTGIQKLMDEVGEDTSRGQEVLSATINLLNAYGFTKLANKFLSRAETLTCEISPDLKETINKNNTIKEGKLIPNVTFTHKLNGKYSSLYDVKAKYKLIMVWASWCSHCQQELPYVKQFYENFKKAGGEIVGLSTDFDKESYENVIKDLPWLNDSDLLYWDSKFAKKLNVTGTPTLFLVDQNNKILKISAKISDINNLIK